MDIAPFNSPQPPSPQIVIDILLSSSITKDQDDKVEDVGPLQLIRKLWRGIFVGSGKERSPIGWEASPSRLRQSHPVSDHKR